MDMIGCFRGFHYETPMDIFSFAAAAHTTRAAQALPLPSACPARGGRLLTTLAGASAITLALAFPDALWAQERPDAKPATPVTLNPIEVVAPHSATDPRAQQRLNPGSVHIVNSDTFYQRSVGNLSDALRYVPGVMAESNTGGDDQVLSIRGSNLSALDYDNGGVALMQDGLPISTADGNNHNRLIDPLTASDLIVANGPNALAYGASELGGAIDVISRTARNSDPRQVYLSGGSHGLFNGRLSTGGISGKLDGMLVVDHKHFDGYRENSAESRTSVYGNIGLKATDTLDLRLFASHTDSRQRLAGSLTRAQFDDDARQADPSYALGNHALNVKTDRLALKGDWTINAASRLEFGLSYETQSLYHPIVDVYNFSTTPPAHYFSLLIDTRQETTGGMLRYHLKAGKHQLLAGLNLAHTSNYGGNYENDGGNKGIRTNDINQQSNSATLFLMDRWQFAPRWTLVYGAQAITTNRNLHDTTLASNDTRHQKASYASVNPRAGLIYALSKNSELFANVSRIYQAPNNFDLDNDVRQNDSTLSAMHGVAVEVGTRGSEPLPFAHGTAHWNLALYHARIHNEILSVDNPAQPGNMLSANYDKTRHTGIEALLGGSFQITDRGQRIEPLVSASYNHFTFDHDPIYGNNRLPSAPRYIVHGEVMVRDAQSGLYAGPTFDLIGSRYVDMANTYRVSGYELLGLRAGIERDRWEIYAQATNLTNKKYVNAVSVRTQASADDAVLNPGAPRALFVGMRLRY